MRKTFSSSTYAILASSHLLAMISLLSRRLIGTPFDSDEREKNRENVTLVTLVKQVKEALNSKLGSILEIKRLPIPFPAKPKKATASSVLRLPNIKR